VNSAHFSLNRILVFAFALGMALAFLVSENAYAYTMSEKEVIRVGYVETKNFSEGAADGEYKTGYAYEYLQKIAAYTGWKYEYVYGDWNEVLEMLENGEIDIMPDVSYTTDRAKKMFFPKYSMGSEKYYIYAYEYQPFALGELDNIAGAKIGCVSNSMQQYYLEKWNKGNDNICEIVTYKGDIGLYNDFESYAIEAIVTTDTAVTPDDEMIPVTSIGESDYYLAVSKSCPDILHDLNNALTRISANEPGFTDGLRNKYFSNSVVRTTLSQEEKEWIKNNPVIKIAYERDFLSFCGYDESTGEVKGALKIFIDDMRRNVGHNGLDVRVVAYDTVEESIEALKNNEVDVVYPIYQNLYLAENNGLYISDALATTSMTAILKSVENFDEFSNNTVAVAKGFSDIQWYVSQNYPNWTIKEYPTFSDCVKAVQNSEADLVVESTYVYKTLIDYRTIKMVSLSKGADVSFCVRRGDKELLSIMNRSIAATSQTAIISAMTQYATRAEKTSFSDYAKDNILFIIIIGAVIVLILTGLFIDANRSARRAILAENAKTSFLFNMSHDIRTPMNAIMGYTHLMKKDIDDKEKLLDHLNKIETSNEILLSLINNVLEMARIDSGKTEIDNIYCDIYELFDGLLPMFTESAQRKNIDFEGIIDVSNRAVMCDTTKIREILINLVNNAIKYTPNGGRVTIRLTELPSNKDGYAILQTVVEDNGIGMNAEYLAHIYDSFSRERTTTESKVEGSGLGMAIVKKLVDIMGGFIDIESEPEKGTKITVTLAHKIAKEEDKPEVAEVVKPPTQTDFKGKRVLLAEDNEMNAEIATITLLDSGFEVEQAMDGAIAVDMIERAEAGYYDLVLMDIQMPNLNGYEATKQIRNMPDKAKANIPIIAVTANAFEEDKREAIEAGMNGHISKPVNALDIYQALTKTFS